MYPPKLLSWCIDASAISTDSLREAAAAASAASAASTARCVQKASSAATVASTPRMRMLTARSLQVVSSTAADTTTPMMRMSTPDSPRRSLFLFLFSFSFFFLFSFFGAPFLACPILPLRYRGHGDDGGFSRRWDGDAHREVAWVAKRQGSDEPRL